MVGVGHIDCRASIHRLEVELARVIRENAELRTHPTPPAGVPEVTVGELDDLRVDGEQMWRPGQTVATERLRWQDWFARRWPARGAAPEVDDEERRGRRHAESQATHFFLGWNDCFRRLREAESLAAALLSAGDAQCAAYREEIERLRAERDHYRMLHIGGSTDPKEYIASRDRLERARSGAVPRVKNNSLDGIPGDDAPHAYCQSCGMIGVHRCPADVVKVAEPESIPLCGDHAGVWYTARNTLRLPDGEPCVVCAFGCIPQGEYARQCLIDDAEAKNARRDRKQPAPPAEEMCAPAMVPSLDHLARRCMQVEAGEHTVVDVADIMRGLIDNIQTSGSRPEPEPTGPAAKVVGVSDSPERDAATPASPPGAAPDVEAIAAALYQVEVERNSGRGGDRIHVWHPPLGHGWEGTLPMLDSDEYADEAAAHETVRAYATMTARALAPILAAERRRARVEALREAAEECDRLVGHPTDGSDVAYDAACETAHELATRIRALAEHGGKEGE